jgi:hypothetical protein
VFNPDRKEKHWGKRKLKRDEWSPKHEKARQEVRADRKYWQQSNAEGKAEISRARLSTLEHWNSVTVVLRNRPGLSLRGAQH